MAKKEESSYYADLEPTPLQALRLYHQVALEEFGELVKAFTGKFHFWNLFRRTYTDNAMHDACELYLIYARPPGVMEERRISREELAKIEGFIEGFLKGYKSGKRHQKE